MITDNLKFDSSNFRTCEHHFALHMFVIVKMFFSIVFTAKKTIKNYFSTFLISYLHIIVFRYDLNICVTISKCFWNSSNTSSFFSGEKPGELLLGIKCLCLITYM